MASSARLRQAHWAGAGGFSLAYVLIAALVLVAGTVTLMKRSSSSLTGMAFQRQSLQAREAARIGMSYLIGEINRRPNRHLLAVSDSQLKLNGDADRTIWTDASAEQYHRNPCLNVRNADGSLTLGPLPQLGDFNLGSGASNSGFFFIQPDGSITKTRGSATRAFRVHLVEPQNNFRLARKSTLSLTDVANTRGFFRFSVEGVLLRSGGGAADPVVSDASAILQEDFDVIPKCCNLSFGGYVDAAGTQQGHGSDDYSFSRPTDAVRTLDNHPCSKQNPDPIQNPPEPSFGVIVGVSGSGATLFSNGQALIKDSKGNIVNPVFCVSASEQSCRDVDNTSLNPWRRIDIKLPPVPQYPGIWSGTPPALQPCNGQGSCPSNKDPNGNRVGQLLYFNKIGAESITVFDAPGVSAANLPSNCTLLGAKNDLHCIYSDLTIVANSNMVFLSGTQSRRIRLYFPQAGYIIDQRGGGRFDHCKNVSRTIKPDNITDMSVFGCSVTINPTCTSQSIDIVGSVNGAGFFLFSPQATVYLKGTAAFQGVHWARGVDMTGTTAVPTVPPSGVVDVFTLIGLLPNQGNNFSDSINGGSSIESDLVDLALETRTEMVARSTNRFRFFGN